MRRIKVTATVLLLTSFCPASPQSVVNTVHNLSVSGPGTVRATSETEVCIFCHTPHNSKPMSPLWNRDDPGGPPPGSLTVHRFYVSRAMTER